MALAAVQTGANNNNNAAFPNLNRSNVVNGIRARINNPYLIDQCFSSLCGPAAFIFCLAKKKPRLYARYVMDLYEKGEANIGSLIVRPRKGCRNFKRIPGTQNNQRITEVDWIALASLRDSENTPSNPDDPPNGYSHPKQQAAGITLPHEMANWFRAAGFASVVNSTNFLFDKSLYHLLEAGVKHTRGHSVCLFVGPNVIQFTTGGSWIPRHWIVLSSTIKVGGRTAGSLLQNKSKEDINNDDTLLSQKIEFDLFTWTDSNIGHRAQPVNNVRPNLTAGQFLNFYYGYVSAL